MSATKFSQTLKLTDSQVNDLARPLMEILERFYQNPKNEANYQKWLESELKEMKCKELLN